VHDLYTRILLSILITDLSAPIWRSIINKYNPKRGIRLREYRVQTWAQIILNLIDGDDDSK